MADQLLSSDPNAGLLSTDPQAGVAPYQGRNVLAEGRQAAAMNGQGEGAQPASGVLAQLNQLLAPYAHPETLTDFGRLLTLPVDEARRAVAAAVAMASAKAPVGHTLTATGRGLEAIGNSRAAQAAEHYGPLDAVIRGDAKGAIATVVPGALRAVGGGMQRLGTAMTTEAPAVVEAAEEAAPAASQGPRTVNDAMADAVKKYQAEAKAKATANATATSRAESGSGGTAPPTDRPASATPPSPNPSAKPRLVGAETKVYMDLRAKGLTEQEAMKLVESARTLARGLPTDADVRAAIAARNASGKWR